MNYKLENKKALGKRIALARMKAGLTQKGLAILARCEQSHIGFYETGKRVPKDETLKRLAEKLNIDYLWLKYGTQSFFDVEKAEFGEIYTINHFPNSTNEKEVNSLLKQLDNNELSVVQELAELLIREKNPEAMREYILKQEEAYQNEIAKLKKVKSKNATPSTQAANDLAMMYKYYNDVFVELMEKKITLEAAYQKTWFKDAQKYPELKAMLERKPNDIETQNMVIDKMIEILEKES